MDSESNRMEKEENIVEMNNIAENECQTRKENNLKSNAQYDKCKIILKNNLLVLMVLVGAALGFAIGFGLRQGTLSEDAVTWIGMPGDIFLRMLKMTILPFVVACIIYETASLDPKANGRLGGLSLVYFFGGNLFGALFAAAMYYIFNTGQVYIDVRNDTQGTQPTLQPQDLIADLVRNFFPDNLVSACFEKVQTKYDAEKSFNGTITYKRVVGKASATNLVGLILVSSVLGMAASMAKENGKYLLQLMKSIMEIMTILLRWIIWTSPIGVMSLIATSIATVDNIEETSKSLAQYLGIYTAGILIFQLILIPLLYFCIKRKNPLRFLLSVARAMMVVFAPPASVVAIPEMIKACEEKHDVDCRVSRFIIPLGATFSRLGSCYFICLSSLQLIRMSGVELDASQILLTTLLSFLGSGALPSIPSASIYAIIVVLTSLNMSTENIGILLALEWYTDRLRSVANALNIVLGTILLDKVCKNTLTSEETKNSHPVLDSETIIEMNEA